MLRELVDLVTYAVTEPIKIVFQLVDEAVDTSVGKTSLKYPISKNSNEPSYGSPIYTDIGFSASGHSGIYVGNNRVIALNGMGDISEVTLLDFVSHPTTLYQHIYVPYYKHSLESAIGFAIAGARAKDILGEKRDYNVLMDNCHQFCSGCLTGDFENADNALWMLKHTVEKEHGEPISWQKWKWR
ncbi:lecithin retinol acyltransferase family protein [Peribacillus sp. NPDC097675]|uniref:lecithin retinol acyltransferase family protein n=1 Tax=Peribacillus sp. NPDC097675 TaxID=3390618 RepID=UPI003D04ABC1